MVPRDGSSDAIGAMTGRHLKIGAGRCDSWPSRLRRQGQAAAVDGLHDLVAAAKEKSCSGIAAELLGIIPVARVAENFRPVGVGDDRFQMQFTVAHFREGADGNLAASAEAVEQSAFAGGSSMGGGVVQKFQLLASGAIAFANFNAEGALAGGGAHDFGGDDLFDEFRFPEALQAGGSEDDCIVFSLLEFAQAGVDVAAQGMNVEGGADRFELRLAA